MKWEGYVARMREERKLYKVLREISKERDLGRPRRRYENEIRIDLREGSEGGSGFGWLRAWTGCGLL
jgi:hypothetical protein